MESLYIITSWEMETMKEIYDMNMDPDRIWLWKANCHLFRIKNWELGFVRASKIIVGNMEKRWKQREIAKIYMSEEMEEINNDKTKIISEENKHLMKSYGKQTL